MASPLKPTMGHNLSTKTEYPEEKPAKPSAKQAGVVDEVLVTNPDGALELLLWTNP